MNKQVIVCVDDEEMILISLKIELKDVFGNEYIIEIAESAEEALELIEELLEEQYEIPLVISDYMMPNMKGDELLKRIHAISPKTRKLMLTGLADIDAVSHAVNYAKLYRYIIAKPWKKEDLILTASEAIKSYLKEKQLADKNKELERKVATFHKFVPDQFLKHLNLKEYEHIQLGLCVEKTMTIMFSDIRDFTALSETMTPQENFDFINDYLSQMEPIIDKHHGFIDKYIGDGIMALFPRGADDAVQAAISMLEQLIKYNNRRLQSKSFEAISIGIGIHTGPLMLGTIGGQNRMDGTVISDAVNLASRVEGLTKTYGTPLLITEQSLQQLIDTSQYKIRIIDNVTVKGKTKAVTVYEVFDADSLNNLNLKLETLNNFEQGIKCFHQEQFKVASNFFKKVLQINENDCAAQIYLNNCENILNMTILQSPRILIVDDTVFDLNILSFVLTKNNFEVSIAHSGEEALQIIKRDPPQLILLDVMMPGIDGFETCRRLKADSKTKDIPIIFMSALADYTEKIKGFEVGAVDYITKPFHNEEILVRIKAHLSLSHLQKQLKAKNNKLEINNLELKNKINKLMGYGA